MVDLSEDAFGEMNCDEQVTLTQVGRKHVHCSALHLCALSLKSKHPTCCALRVVIPHVYVTGVVVRVVVAVIIFAKN